MIEDVSNWMKLGGGEENKKILDEHDVEIPLSRVVIVLLPYSSNSLSN